MREGASKALWKMEPKVQRFIKALHVRNSQIFCGKCGQKASFTIVLHQNKLLPLHSISPTNFLGVSSVM